MKTYQKVAVLSTLIAGAVLTTQLSISAEQTAAVSKVTFLDQNWSNADRAYFYFADQGSRLIPYDYFLHLEQAGSEALFRSDANMKRIGLIPLKPVFG